MNIKEKVINIIQEGIDAFDQDESEYAKGFNDGMKMAISRINQELRV